MIHQSFKTLHELLLSKAISNCLFCSLLQYLKIENLVVMFITTLVILTAPIYLEQHAGLFLNALRLSPTAQCKYKFALQIQL
jgi:hypothetical protein